MKDERKEKVLSRVRPKNFLKVIQEMMCSVWVKVSIEQLQMGWEKY